MLKWFSLLITCFLLIGCEAKMNPPQKNPQPSPPAVVDEQNKTLRVFFPHAPVEKMYLGVGNEFAQYTEKFYENEGPYFPAVMDNGGNRFFRIYKITDNEISLVYEQPDFFEEEIPAPSSLENRFLVQPLLRLPLEVGEKVGQWKIASVTEKLSLPIGDFSDVVVIQKANEDGSIIRQYWAKNYGKIKDEFLLKDDSGNINEVSSELQTMK
ncbi:MAG TPA: hypothetical protein VEV44_07835 [Pseudoneobacillus sp.]|nr:hypothetical protein [Pseudoneobacillus sp.]